MSKKALTAALVWAVAVEAVGFVLKFGFDWSFSMLGIHIGVVITAVAEYFIVRSREIKEEKRRAEANKRLENSTKKKKIKMPGTQRKLACPVFFLQAILLPTLYIFSGSG